MAHISSELLFNFYHSSTRLSDECFANDNFHFYAINLIFFFLFIFIYFYVSLI